MLLLDISPNVVFLCPLIVGIYVGKFHMDMGFTHMSNITATGMYNNTNKEHRNLRGSVRNNLLHGCTSE